MRKSRLQKIKRQQDSLHEHEVEHLSTLLCNFSSQNKKIPLSLVFWNTILEHNELENLELELQHRFDDSQKLNNAARQWERHLVDNLLLNVNIEADGIYSEVVRHKMRIEQQLLFANILIDKELYEEALDHLLELEDDARTYELYKALLKIQNLKQNVFVELNKFKQLTESLKNEKFYDQCHLAVTNAKKAYFRAIQNYGFKGNSHSSTDIQRQALLKSDIALLAEDFETTGAAIIGYYHHLLKVELLQLQQKFGKATKYCLESLEIIRNNPSVYHSTRLGIAYLNLSQNELFNHSFDYALGFAQQAQDCFQVGSRNYHLSLDLEFYALFYAGKTKSSGEVLDRLLSENQRGVNIESPDFRTSVRNYLLACVHFVMQDFREVHRTLHGATRIKTDQEGWNLGMRILTVMNLLELGLKDHADNEIDNMRKFARERLANTPVRTRDRAIVELFSNLKRSNYNFEQLLDISSDLLQKLSSNVHALAWKVQTPELIAVHLWFAAKIKGKFYRPDYSQEALFGPTV